MEILEMKVSNLSNHLQTSEPCKLTTLAYHHRSSSIFLHCIPFRTRRRFRPGGVEAGTTQGNTVRARQAAEHIFFHLGSFAL
jgi:hypothetical protein